MELIEDGVRVELESIGEGREGDYDPTDPQDVELLRFAVSLVEPDPDNPDYPEDASYCTSLPVALPEEYQLLVCQAIMREVKDEVLARRSIKKRCEVLSWLGHGDLPRLIV